MKNNEISNEETLFIIEDNPYLNDDPGSDGEKKRKSILNSLSASTVVELKDIYQSCIKDSPTPFGKVVVADSGMKTDEYTIGWNTTGLGIDINGITQFGVELAFIPVEHYPVINFSIVLNDGNGDNLLADFNFDINLSSHRILVYDLLNSENANVFLFENTGELQLFEFSIPILHEERLKFYKEVKSCFSSLSDYKDLLAGSNWELGLGEVCNNIRPGGTPLNEDVKKLYNERLKYPPEPEVNFWKNFNS